MKLTAVPVKGLHRQQTNTSDLWTVYLWNFSLSWKLSEALFPQDDGPLSTWLNSQVMCLGFLSLSHEEVLNIYVYVQSSSRNMSKWQLRWLVSLLRHHVLPPSTAVTGLNDWANSSLESLWAKAKASQGVRQPRNHTNVSKFSREFLCNDLDHIFKGQNRCCTVDHCLAAMRPCLLDIETIRRQGNRLRPDKDSIIHFLMLRMDIRVI